MCSVTSCVYNNDQKFCTAKEIKVSPQQASTSSNCATSADTLCVTFRPQ
jgi:hypothetical protein